MVNKYAPGKTNASTAGVTTDLTIPGFGTCKAARVWICHATADATPIADEFLSEGVWAALGTQWSTQHTGEDGTTDTNCHKSAHSARVAQIMSTASGTATVDNWATAAAITDGIRLTFNATPSAAWRIMFTLYGGDDLVAEAGTIVSSSTLDGTVVATLNAAYNKRPELIYTATVPGQTVWDGTVYDDSALCLGCAHDNGTTIRQVSGAWEREDAVATSNHASYFTSIATGDRCLRPAAAIGIIYQTNRVSATAIESITFQSKDRATPTQRIGFLALSWGGQTDIRVEDWDADFTVASPTAVTFVGFQADYIEYLASNSVAGRDTSDTGNLAGPWTVGITDGSAYHAIIGRWRNVTDQDADVEYAAEWIRVKQHQGPTAWAANVLDSIDATGFTYTPDTTSGSPKHTWLVALRDRGVAPNPVSIPIVVPALTLDMGTKIVGPGPVAVPIATPAPSLDLGSIAITPAPAVLPILTAAPSLNMGTKAVTPAALALPVVLPGSSLDMGSIALSPVPLSVPILAAAHALDMGTRLISPSALAVPLVLPTTDLVMGTLLLSPSPLAVPLVVPAPSVSLGGLSIAPAPLAIPLVLPGASLTHGTLVLTPAALQVPIVAPAPSRAPGTLNLSPAALAVPILTASPALDMGTLTLTPATLAVPILVPTHTVGSALVIQPAALAVPLVLPGVTLAMGTRLVEPAALAVPITPQAPSLDMGTLTVAPAALSLPIVTVPPSLEQTLTLSPAALVVPLSLPGLSLDMGTRGISPAALTLPILVTIPTLDLPTSVTLTFDRGFLYLPTQRLHELYLWQTRPKNLWIPTQRERNLELH